MTTDSEDLVRRGFLLRVEGPNGTTGIGEVAPLAGLHAESLLDAEEQICLVCSRLEGVEVPLEVAFLAGSLF